MFTRTALVALSLPEDIKEHQSVPQVDLSGLTMLEKRSNVCCDLGRRVLETLLSESHLLKDHLARHRDQGGVRAHPGTCLSVAVAEAVGLG